MVRLWVRLCLDQRDPERETPKGEMRGNGNEDQHEAVAIHLGAQRQAFQDAVEAQREDHHEGPDGRAVVELHVVMP